MARNSRKNLVTEPITTAGINTALYIRLSVEDGHGRGNSIENQQLILNDLCATNPNLTYAALTSTTG